MVQVVLNQEQAKLIQESLVESVQPCDPQGKVIRTLEPELTPEFIAELKRRAAKPGPRFTGAQVQARLRALQAEWDRMGGFDEVYMRQFMASLNVADPGHMRPLDSAYDLDWTDDGLNARPTWQRHSYVRRFVCH